MKNARFIDKHLIHNATKFMSVRHEDFSADPTMVTRKIYSFVGKTPPSDLLRWIKFATTSRSVVKNSFDTIRVSAEVTTAWRQWYTMGEVNVVQKLCRKALSYHNYTSFRHQVDLKDDHYPSF